MGFEQYKSAFFETGLIKDACRANCENELLALQKFLKENDVIVLKTARAGFKKQSILIEFCRIFLDKFNYYLEKFPILKQELDQKGISYNLVEELTKNSTCHDFSESIYQIYNQHASSIDHFPSLQSQNEECKPWIQALEFLHFIYEITHLLSKGQLLDKNNDEHHRIHTRRPQIDWCAFCFRRVESIGEQRPLQTISNIHGQRFPENKSRKSKQLLCKKHVSSKENDSIYRSARKKAKSLSEIDRNYIDQIHSERRLYEVLNFNKPVDHKMTAEQWEISKSKWLGYLSELCPYAYISDITSWDQFTARFHLLLDNEHEDTKIPFFIEDIYMEAKIWIELQKNHYMNDKRRKSL